MWVNDWLNGTTPHDLLAVRRLAKALGVSVSFLLYGEKEDPVNFSIEEIIEKSDSPIMSGLYHIEVKKVNINEFLFKKK